MLSSEYLEELRKVSDVIRDIRPKLVLLLAQDMNFIISFSLYEDVKNILLQSYNENVKKLAVVVISEDIMGISMSEAIKHSHLEQKFQVRYFSDEVQARQWLLGD